MRERGDFEALLVRGTPVRRGLHVLVAVCVFALAAGAARALDLGWAGLVAAAAAGGAYLLFGLMLVLTGGEELERIAVDEHGTLTSTKSGRDVEARGDFLRWAIPAAVIAVCGFQVLTLGRDIVFPPPPHCNVAPAPGSDACLTVNLGGIFQPGTGSVPPESGATPAPSPTGATTGEDSTGAFTIEQTKWIERAIRSGELLFFLVIGLGATWFLRRMLTGRWVVGVRPIRHRSGDG
jgi:hypothetical protein